MAVTRRKTNDVLASARKDLQAQLALVREEMSRLAAEENALTEALSSLDGKGASSSPRAPAGKARGKPATAKRSARGSSTRKAPAGRRRSPRSASKPTAERVKELRGLLAEGPKSKNALAEALKVSPQRVQQLLRELDSSVSSERDPNQRAGKLWSLKASGNGASATKPTAKRRSARANGASAKKRPARKKAAAK